MLSEKNENNAELITAIHYQYFRNINTLLKNYDTGKFDISFIGNEEWKKIYFTPGSAKFSQKPEETNNGPLYHLTVQYNSPGQNPGDQAELEDLNGQKLVFRLEFSNGDILLIGTNKYAARFSDDFQADDKASGSQVNISVSQPKRAYFLNS